MNEFVTTSESRTVTAHEIFNINKYIRTMNIGQLPWHIDTALLAVGFMMAGMLFKKFIGIIGNNKEQLFTDLGLLSIAVYAIMTNSEIDMNQNKTGNLILFYVGGILMSYCIMGVCKRVNRNRFLEYFGRYTIVIMAFNSAINSYSKAIWTRLAINNYIKFTWPVVIVFNLIGSVVLITIWQRMRSDKCHIEGRRT